MKLRTHLATALALFATVVALAMAPASDARTPQSDGVRALDGEWLFVEDRTEGRSLEQLGAPMSSKFSLRVEDGAIVLNGHGSGHKDVRVALDGSTTEIAEQDKKARYRGAWKDGEFGYDVEFVRGPDNARDGSIGLIRREFRPTAEGLIVRVAIDPPQGKPAVALYQHVEDIPLPTPAKAAIADVGWIAGAWVGTRSSGSAIEERWGPPLGGAMLATSRTVNKSGKMSAFEYLRIVERDGGLVYVAQPGGKAPTEFVLTEIGATRAVFLNPRHDYPRRIVYELAGKDALTATAGQLKGGTPQRYEFKREGS
ncbi:MAG: hypothetical protein EPO68_17980 [Planctomycetota bacterium]|nr:MAG: hypothetical protein EPO68_17980 [Planctomycetota bacterium]